MTRKPIVLLISDEYPPYTNWGGVAYHSASLAKLLNRAGYDVEVIAETDDGEEFTHLDKQGNLVHRVNGERSWSFKLLQTLAKPFGKGLDFRNLMFAALSFRLIRKLARPFGKGLAYRDLRFALRVAEKAFELTHVWGREILWVETTSWRAQSVVLQLLPSLNARTIVRNVTPLAEVVRANQAANTAETKLALVAEQLQQLLAKNRFYSNAEYSAYFEEMVRPRGIPGWNRAAERVFLLPFDFSRIEKRRPKTRARRGKAPLRLLMIGRLEPRKGFDEICSALAGLDAKQRAEVRIVAVGRDTPYGPLGSYRKLLFERFAGIADTCFEFHGQVTDDNLRRMIQEADIGLVASTSESFGYNLVELIAAGLPVITSDVGAASELERRGVHYLGKYQNVDGLREILTGLPEKLARYERNAPDNRTQLEAIYRDNDAAYLAYVREQVTPAAAPPKPARAAVAPLKTVDVVIPSYNRFDELTLSLASVLKEIERARRDGIDCGLTIVYQNEGLPERLYAWRPDLRKSKSVHFVFSSPPSLTHARNTGLANTNGDLVIFVDDDVLLEPGFIEAHLEAANAHPRAIGVAGAIIARQVVRERTHKREVGHIHLDGFIECNFDSCTIGSVLAPQTPMGANMAYKRAPMNALFGPAWFDERFVGSAFREESMLAIQILRSGAHFVFAPAACLYHFESVDGGCNNRSKRTLGQRINHDGLDDLYLMELYDQMPWLRWAAPAMRIRDDLRNSDNLKTVLVKSYINAGAYLKAWQLRAARRPRELPVAPPPLTVAETEETEATARARKATPRTRRPAEETVLLPPVVRTRPKRAGAADDDMLPARGAEELRTMLKASQDAVAEQAVYLKRLADRAAADKAAKNSDQPLDDGGARALPADRNKP